VSVDIIQFIPRPKRDDMQTDFSAIAFRAARRNPTSDPVDAASDNHTAPASQEA